MKHVKERIIEVRRARGLTQTALADRIGKNLHWVHRRESGLVPITLEDLETLARGLRVSSKRLFDAPLSQTLPKVSE